MQKEFTKADLKDGMVVEYQNGFRRLVVGDMLIGQNGWLDLGEFNYDLRCSGYDFESLHIVKVYETKCPRSFGALLDDDNLELIWQRTETKRMTAEEMRKKLEELTGEKIEIEPSREEMVQACYEYCRDYPVMFCIDCPLRGVGSCNFKQLTNEELKECYEKVMEDGRKE